MKERNERFGVYQDNGKKAHSQMHGCCNKVIQTHLENDSDFESEVKGDPFEMMEMTKPKMHHPSKIECPCVTSFEQLDGNTKQDEDEALIKCTKRFKQAQDDMRSIMGTEWLDKFMENMEEHVSETDNDAKEELKKTSCESFVAHAFLRNCDSLKCGN